MNGMLHVKSFNALLWCFRTKVVLKTENLAIWFRDPEAPPFIARLRNGSALVSGTSSQGSNPCRATNAERRAFESRPTRLVGGNSSVAEQSAIFYSPLV